MCECCPVEAHCYRCFKTQFDHAAIVVGFTRRGRIAICIRENGIESQHIFMAWAGAFALIEATASAIRVLGSLPT